MKVPSNVIWNLTKKWNSHLVKFRDFQFSHDPLNLTGFHNASSSGNIDNCECNLGTRDNAVGVQAIREK